MRKKAKSKRLLWLPTCGQDSEFWTRLEKVNTQKELFALLVEAHQKEWVMILGNTDKSPEDIAAVLQEFWNVQVIKDDQIRGGRSNE